MSEQAPLRVWHVDSGKRHGGGQVQISHLLNGLVRRGVACTLVCPKESPIPSLGIPPEIEIIHLNLRSEWDLPSIWKLRRTVRLGRPDILHAHDATAHTICLLARTDRQKMVVHRRVSFPIHRHVLTRWKYGTGVDRYIAVAECVRDRLVEIGVPKEKVAVIHSAVDLSRFENIGQDIAAVREEFGLTENRKIIGTVGRLTREKRYDWLLDTLKSILENNPAYCLVLAGDGPERGALESQAEHLGIREQIVFAGHREDVPRLLSAFDVYVLCSESEGYPVSLAEAMAAGCAVVSTDVGGVSEIVRPGENGIVVSPDDGVQLRDAVGDLLQNEQSRMELGRAGRESAMKKMGAEAIVESVLKLYNECIL
ncbi:MAG TPA: glycosyltransferase [bacterium]|mgnify:CR=1 FL=1|nr:glycosyltransferase [bacterium]HQO34829.1 glycosyltransferase [bacterium]HQP97203.1 glycosyltransferase [bacterium]